MFRNLRRKSEPEQVTIDPTRLSSDWLARDASAPISLKQINDLSDNAKKRIYRNLIPPALLTRFSIDPITWQGADGELRVGYKAEPGTGKLDLWACQTGQQDSEFFRMEVEDNAFNGIDAHLLLLNDPEAERFLTDLDDQGRETMFGTLRRNLGEEQRAMQSGLAPGQIRRGLGASRVIFEHLDTFCATLGQQAYFLEPLTYASAWVFERRGFAYVRGHKLMDDIHQEFQPGGRLHRALDSSSPFRQPDQWNSVRGRAWAIHDGILEVIDARWDNLRMVKQVGKHAGVQTFPDENY